MPRLLLLLHPSEGLVHHKSLTQALRAPFLPRGAATTDKAHEGTDASVGGRSRSAGGLASLGGLFRSPSQHHLGRRGEDKSARGRRPRSRSRSRHGGNAKRLPSARLSDTDSGGESGEYSRFVRWGGALRCAGFPSGMVCC